MKIKRILVVDDSRTNLKLIAAILSGEGYEVFGVPNAEAAEISIASHSFDLILMDIELPGIDGLTLTKKLKAKDTTKHIPIICLTAYAMKDDKAKAYAAGCDGYMTKPINSRTFVREMLDFLSGD